MRVLVLNPGSATLKATLLDAPGFEPRFDRTVRWEANAGLPDRVGVVREVLAELARAEVASSSIQAVGYRVVHGGERFVAPVLVDDDVVDDLEALTDLAPLHNPPAVATIRAVRDVLPGIPHVAAFDTAFHATLPETARRYPVPEAWTERWGVRRYGFHGLSVSWSVRRASELLGREPDSLRLVVAHLGGGCSVTAVDSGRSVDTSMGMTPLEGLMMGTRAGSIDPGIVFRLLRAGAAAEDIADDLEHRSGLLGVSGRTAEMRDLLEAEAAGDDRAALAIEMFVRRAAAGIAAAATALPGVDALVFTGGIGENAAPIRGRIVERLSVLGFSPLASTSASGDSVLSAGPPAVLRIAAREDVVIASAAEAALAAVGRKAGRA